MHRYEASASKEVREVYNIAKKSAIDGLPSALVERAVALEKSPDGTWTVCDNYERFCSTLLDWKNGQWTTRGMWSESPPEKISHEEACANAQIMFHG